MGNGASTIHKIVAKCVIKFLAWYYRQYREDKN